MSLTLLVFFRTEISMASNLKKTKVKLELTDFDMLLMMENDIRGGICYAIHR